MRFKQGVEFPALSGPYAVGHTDYELVDTSRPEIFTDDPKARRDLLVTVYYPAQVPAAAVPAPYVTNKLGTLFGLTPELIAQIHPHSYTNVPAIDQAFPVLIFSPGMGARPLFYSSLLTDLASQGYVVLSLWHPYSTSITVYPDGRIIPRNAAGTADFSSDGQAAAAEKIGAVWVEDMRFVLNQLAVWNADDALLVGRLDLEHIGAFGHSFGGATAVQAAYEDKRIAAALNMDGTMFGAVTQQGSRVPFLLLQSAVTMTFSDAELMTMGLSRAKYDALMQRYHDSIHAIMTNSAVASAKTLPNSQHNSYSPDFLLLAPLLPAIFTVDEIGTIDPLEAYQQILTWVSDFMATYVKGN
ncbi:MAG: hypothetical protein K8L91_30260 [Anaerolineae bacterium]|nr:hypothetical protein [Anaerolineae bacterium]